MQCRVRGRQFGKVALVDDKIIEVPPRRLFTDSKTLGWDLDFGFWILIRLLGLKVSRRPSNHTRVQAPPAYNCPNLGEWGGER